MIEVLNTSNLCLQTILEKRSYSKRCSIVPNFKKRATGSKKNSLSSAERRSEKSKDPAKNVVPENMFSEEEGD